MEAWEVPNHGVKAMGPPNAHSKLDWLIHRLTKTKGDPRNSSTTFWRKEALRDSSPSRQQPFHLLCFRAQTTFTCTTVSINPHTTLWRLARWRNKFRKVKYQRSSDLSTASVAEAALAKSDGQTHKSNHHLVTHHGSLSSSIPQNRQKTLVRSKGVHFSCWWLLPDLPIRKQYHKTGLNFYQISQATYLNNKHLKSSSQSFSRTKAVGLV